MNSEGITVFTSREGKGDKKNWFKKIYFNENYQD